MFISAAICNLCAILASKFAEHLGNNGHHFFLLFVGVAVGHVFQDRVQCRGRCGTEVQNHDHFALGELVRLQFLDELLDAGRVVGQRLLAEGARSGAEILEELRGTRLAENRLEFYDDRSYLSYNGFQVGRTTAFDLFVAVALVGQVLEDLVVAENSRLRFNDFHDGGGVERRGENKLCEGIRLEDEFADAEMQLECFLFGVAAASPNFFFGPAESRGGYGLAAANRPIRGATVLVRNRSCTLVRREVACRDAPKGATTGLRGAAQRPETAVQRSLAQRITANHLEGRFVRGAC